MNKISNGHPKTIDPIPIYSSSHANFLASATTRSNRLHSMTLNYKSRSKLFRCRSYQASEASASFQVQT
jgi:spermidine synthase